MSRQFRKGTALGAFLCFVAAAGVARARIDSVGGLGSAFETTMSGMTFVDLNRGATDSGDYSTATVFWERGSGAACPGSFMLRFYRPLINGTTLLFLDERGPFTSTNGLIDVNLSPPVSLLQGDLVGITELGANTCGGVALITGGGNPTLSIPGDSGESDVTVCDTLAVLIPQTIGVIARSMGTTVRGGVVLGAGSGQGAQNSNFRTSMQMANPGLETIQGHLIFHAQGTAGSPNDPSLAYSIAPAHTLAFADVVAAIGVNGIGSIDVSVDSSYAPLVIARIFNDGGAAGTDGFSEPMVRPGDDFVIDTNQSAWLIAPADFTKFRMNIGVRSLAEGASLKIRVFAGDGTILGTVVKNYPPDEFDLQSASSYLAPIALPANGLIQVQVASGRAIVGGVTVDNITNDTSLQLGTRNHF